MRTNQGAIQLQEQGETMAIFSNASFVFGGRRYSNDREDVGFALVAPSSSFNWDLFVRAPAGFGDLRGGELRKHYTISSSVTNRLSIKPDDDDKTLCLILSACPATAGRGTSGYIEYYAGAGACDKHGRVLFHKRPNIIGNMSSHGMQTVVIKAREGECFAIRYADTKFGKYEPTLIIVGNGEVWVNDLYSAEEMSERAGIEIPCTLHTDEKGGTKTDSSEWLLI
jgi:hypothetical protein